MQIKLIRYLADSYINRITSKKIHVLSSHYPEYALSEELASGKLVMAKGILGFSRMAILENNGDFYSLKVNASYTCIKNSMLIKCKNPTPFGLVESKYGYKLVYYDKCLTISNKMAFSDCAEDHRNQDLVFEDKSAFYCKEDRIPPEDEPEEHKKPSSSSASVNKKLAKELEKHGIKNKDMQKALKKMWNWKFGFWPKFGLCNI